MRHCETRRNLRVYNQPIGTSQFKLCEITIEHPSTLHPFYFHFESDVANRTPMFLWMFQFFLNVFCSVVLWTLKEHSSNIMGTSLLMSSERSETSRNIKSVRVKTHRERWRNPIPDVFLSVHESCLFHFMWWKCISAVCVTQTRWASNNTQKHT